MKKLLLLIVFMFFLSCSKDNSTPALAIGQDYKGGVIFYIDSTGQHGLIVSYSSSEAKWGCTNILVSGANGTNIGTGSQNTLDIVNGCSNAVTAARICSDCTDGGFSDWYLPSRSELSYLHLKKVSLPNVSLPAVNVWSSTQNSSGGAWYQHFGGNPGEVFPSVATKDYVYRVCPIRSF